MGINMPNMGRKAVGDIRNQPITMVDALFSKTQQRVLALLFGQPERSFYATEIISLSEGGSGAIQRELSKLSQSGLINETRIGSQRHFQANADAPIFAELCAIVRKTIGLAEPLRSALKPLAEQIDLAFVFGSVAKKSDSAASDIDLMVISDTLVYADVYQALEELANKLGRTIQPTLYSKEELAHRRESDNAFMKRVLKQPKIWIIGEESDFPTA
jgi:predicted nucleotidyltransferase